MANKKVWDYLAWLCLAGITLWLILKMLGIINTPIWLQYAPLYGAVYLAGWAMSKLEDVRKDVGYLKKEVSMLKDEAKNTQFEISKINTRCIAVCKR